MLVDKISNWNLLLKGSTWEKVFGFINTINETSEEKKYEIDGDNIYAQISNYSTKQFGLFETHKKYIDVQVVLSGEEIIRFTNMQGLQEHIPYNQNNDITFFTPTDTMTPIYLSKNYFAVFFPHDAHMPQIMISHAGIVKKLVVKVSSALILK